MAVLLDSGSCRDVAENACPRQRRCTSLLIQGWRVENLILPPIFPPLVFFSRGEKFILHIIWILLMVKCLSFGALCSGVISYFATQLKVLALVEVYKLFPQKKKTRGGKMGGSIRFSTLHPCMSKDMQRLCLGQAFSVTSLQDPESNSTANDSIIM